MTVCDQLVRKLQKMFLCSCGRRPVSWGRAYERSWGECGLRAPSSHVHPWGTQPSTRERAHALRGQSELRRPPPPVWLASWPHLGASRQRFCGKVPQVWEALLAQFLCAARWSKPVLWRAGRLWGDRGCQTLLCHQVQTLWLVSSHWTSVWREGKASHSVPNFLAALLPITGG